MIMHPPFLSPGLTEALGWTLIHTLWQGLLIGLLVLIILVVRREAGPQFRYLVRVMGLAAILASAVLTFSIECRHSAGPGNREDLSPLFSKFEPKIQITDIKPQVSKDLHSSNMSQSLQGSLPWVSSVWLLGVFLLSLRLAGGMFQANRLRSEGVSPLPDWLETRFRKLITRSGVEGSVRVRISGKVAVPLVIGIIRPAILMPAAMISLMPVEQLDSILAHELAHVKRHDLLVNLIQSLMEVLFFFHPAVWILSEGIRRDREQCCDDLALDLCGKLSDYARALAGLSELQAGPYVHSVALSRGKKHLLNRVERLIKPKKMKTNATEKFVAGMLILGSAIILTLGTGASLKSQQSPQGASLQVDLQSYARAKLPDSHSEADDTLKPDSKQSIRVKDNVVTRTFVDAGGQKKEMRFVIRGGMVRELYVDGERVPDDNFPAYRKEIDRTMKDLKQMQQDLQYARQEIDNVDMEAIQKELREEMERFRQQDMAKLQEEMKQMQEQTLKEQFDSQKMQEEIKKAMEEARLDQENMKEEIMKSREEAKKALEKASKEAGNALDEEQIAKIEEAVAQAMEQLRNFDADKMKEQFERQVQQIQNIDFEKIQEQLEMSMQKIDFAEMEKNLQKTMEDLKLNNADMDRQKKKLDEMIDELEKLELGKED